MSDGASHPAQRADGDGPRGKGRSLSIFTIAPGQPFLDVLAEGIFERFGRPDEPEALADCLVLLPTRRAVRSLTEAFLSAAERRGSPALALPRIRPIGDVDEDALVLEEAGDLLGGAPLDLPPAMPGLRRQMLLTRLVMAYAGQPASGLAGIGIADGASLAAELGRFIDFVAAEGADLSGLETLAPPHLAAHWQTVLEFLRIVTANWPQICREAGAMDGAERRDLLLRRLGERFRTHPPAGPVVAAGSTGSIPATADLLAAIAALPRGTVVLPGLDLALDRESWDAIGPGHPQATMKSLLMRMEADRASVELWGGNPDPAPAARARLIGEALRPADTTHRWPRMAQHIDVETASGGLSLIEAQSPNEEAAVIALALREALETPGRTAALVTPDRVLARLVAVELARWTVEIDDSAGYPLSRAVPAVFLRLLLDAVDGDFGPVALLALLRHPLCRLGLSRADLAARAARLDALALRGSKPAAGIGGLRARLAASDLKEDEPLFDLLNRLDAACADLTTLWRAGETDLPALASALAGAGEALAAEHGSPGALDHASGARRLWAGDGGEALSGLLADIGAQGGALGALPPRVFVRLFNDFVAAVTVRPRYGKHPRLHIWGPLEARLQQPDFLVLGGLNEGVWPADPGHDPWLSRPMRAQLGLPPPEQRIGLAAHDFAQAAASRRVLLTRATRADGVPTVASRWLMRLKNLLKGAGVEHCLNEDAPYLAWSRALRTPAQSQPLAPPRPVPPRDARPRTLPVTDIERLVRDPYSIYAKRILRLRPLAELEEVPGPAERGTLIHAALERFVARHPKELPGDACTEFLQILREELGAETASRPEVAAFWWPRFERLADWFLEREALLRRDGLPAAMECVGKRTLSVGGRDFVLTARADRIDRLKDGTLAVYDYKTGGAPTASQVEAGFAPQLPLEAAIAAAGGFEGVEDAAPGRLAYIRLTGAKEAGEWRPIAEGREDTGALCDEALASLQKLLARYAQADMPYLAKPRPQFRNDPGDYDHLARIAEWSTGAEGGS